MDNDKVILELRDVSKIYESVNALSNINLKVKKGDWIAIMGSSGSGKTTMMNIIGCMDRPSNGQVLIDGVDISKESQKNLTNIRREKIGLIFQQFHLISYLTALENVMVAQYYHSMIDEKEALEALKKVGLGDRAKHLPSQLSGGEQQRVCIARALVNKPKYLIADEPTGNLDPNTSEGIMKLLLDVNAKGTTVIVSTHDRDIVNKLKKRVISMDHGEMINDEERGGYFDEFN